MFASKHDVKRSIFEGLTKDEITDIFKQQHIDTNYTGLFTPYHFIALFRVAIFVHMLYIHNIIINNILNTNIKQVEYIIMLGAQ